MEDIVRRKRSWERERWGIERESKVVEICRRGAMGNWEAVKFPSKGVGLNSEAYWRTTATGNGTWRKNHRIPFAVPFVLDSQGFCLAVRFIFFPLCCIPVFFGSTCIPLFLDTYWAFFLFDLLLEGSFLLAQVFRD